MSKSRAAAVIICVVVLAPLRLYGDSWAAATPKVVASPDGERLVRVEPGQSLGDTMGFAGADRGPFARATYYRRNGDNDTYEALRTVELENPVSPVDIFLSNDGVLVTLDNWHNVGYGAVVVVYGTDGKLAKSYELEDFYTKDRIHDVPTSVSSRWWRCATVQPWISDSELWLRDTFGGEFRFDLATGAYEYDESAGACVPQ